MPNSQPLLYAFGGALGALVLRSLLKAAAYFWFWFVPIADYDCGTDEAGPGMLRHGRGARVKDANARYGYAWQYDKQHSTGAREHAIFGPYVNDFGRPGHYRVRFRLTARGIVGVNRPVVFLDITRSPFGTKRDLVIIGQRILRAKDLRAAARGKYKNFDLYCYSEGHSVYEYRCSVVPSAVEGDEERFVRFDSVHVYRHFSLFEAL